MPAVSKSVPPPQKMTVDEFMKWYETAEGRWELHDGVPVRKHDPAKGQSERIAHLEVKFKIARILDDALRKAKRSCFMLPDGASVRINEQTHYEPDALVYCGERLDKGAIIVPDPVIIVEVLSPGTRGKDLTDKLKDYFTLPSVAHYLVLDPERETIMHYFRETDHLGLRHVTGPHLALEPPGLTIDLEELFS